MWEALAVLEESSLPMSFRIGTFSDMGCEPLGLNEILPLPAGLYTLRLQLNDIDMDGQKLDLGVFDLPVTVQP